MSEIEVLITFFKAYKGDMIALRMPPANSIIRNSNGNINFGDYSVNNEFYKMIIIPKVSPAIEPKIPLLSTNEIASKT